MFHNSTMTTMKRVMTQLVSMKLGQISGAYQHANLTSIDTAIIADTENYS